MEAATAAPHQKAASTEVPQYLMALEKANQVRLARAELKDAIAKGAVQAAAVVRMPPREATRMSVAELLTSQRQWGSTRARRFLVPFRISENQMLGALTKRQRRIVAAELERRSASGARTAAAGVS